MSSTVKIGWLKDSNGEKFAPKTLVSQVQTKDGKPMEDWLDEATVKEIYVGDGNMPEDATVQILLDGSDEEQALKDELKDHIKKELQAAKDKGEFDGEDGKDGYTPVKDIDYFDGKTAYEYAKDGGYTGTEAEFAAEVARYANLNAETTALRELVENIDVQGDINAHNSDVNAHQDLREAVDNILIPVLSVNGQIGEVNLTLADLGAAPAYSYGTDDLVAGTSPLETGKLYFVYEV